MSDIMIKYNDENICELNESGNVVLKTALKKCISDIEVEYTKPGGGGITTPKSIRLVNNYTGAGAANFKIPVEDIGCICKIENQMITLLNGNSSIGFYPPSDNEALYLPVMDEEGTSYYFACFVYASGNNDEFNVTCNGTPVAYNSNINGYMVEVSETNLADMPDIVITVADKE